MKAIKLTVKEWDHVLEHITAHHPASVRLVREKMRKVMGFTPRDHQEWIVFDMTGDRERKVLKEEVHLDFYSDSQRTMFLLKYSEWINKG
jgi:hypothetical protein